MENGATRDRKDHGGGGSTVRLVNKTYLDVEKSGRARASRVSPGYAAWAEKSVFWEEDRRGTGAFKIKKPH